jgi:hypothetical protein
MALLIDKHVIQRVPTAFLLSFIWGGLGACAIGATIYDIAFLLGQW